jgi:photosystem II stability/assembly factor-like uncharacterized protein
MRRLVFLLFLFSLALQAQIPQNAPWMIANDSVSRVAELTYDQMVANAQTYFNAIDINKKGSGYKPFKRWEYHWDFYKQSDGSIAPASLLWDAWRQKQEMSQNQNNRSTQVVSNWQSVGPYSFTDTGSWGAGQGRVNCVTVDPNNPNIYYVGAPVGGIWKTTDAGITWTALTDYLPQIGVSGIAVDPSNSNILYITTGDDDAGDSYFVGVKKSIDGGITWNDTGALGGETANEIYIDPTNSQIIWVATSSGLYKSINGGTTWAMKRLGNIKDFKLKPGDPNTIYAVSTSAFYKSTNGGTNFSTISNGLPSSSSRLTIDVTPANPEYVYVLSAVGNAFQGVYKSTNSGTNFTKTLESDDIFDGSSQAWYDMALGVSNTDANTLFVGVLNVWKSTDGGNNFNRINTWNADSEPAYTHADIHFLRYYNGVLFAGTDGGIYRSVNNGNSFTSLTTGLAIGQFYRISVAKQSAQNVVGGLQDNGGYARSNNQWYNYHGADGMDAAVNPMNKNQYYGFIQYGGALYKTENGGESSSYVAEGPVSGNWVTPLVANNTGELYAGFNHLYKLENSLWTQVSNFNFGGNIAQIEIDPSDNNIIYVSRGLNLYKTINNGSVFTNLNVSFTGSSISSIEVNNHNSAIIYVTTSGSNGKVYKSVNGGTSWSDISSNLPAESKNVVRHQKYNAQNPIYVGTYLGVYYLDDTDSNWQVFSTNLPNAEVTDIEITEIDGIISASTYGRGVWQSAIPVVLPSTDLSLLEISQPLTSVTCGEVSPIIKVKNTGANTINQIQINYTIDDIPHNEVWNGTLASGGSIDISLLTYSLSRGAYTLDVTATSSGDTYADNNVGSVTFYINDSDDTPHIVNPFENSTDTWLVVTQGTTDGSDLWQMDSPGTTFLNTVSSGTKAYITNPDGKYSHNTVSDLVTPCYDLTTVQNPVMRFNLAFDIEVDWDVLYVQYSTDNGSTWQVLGTANDPNWYNNSSSENELTIGGQWSGINTTLQEYSYDLAALNDATQIIFRFHFASDPAVDGEGALIDDFVIDGVVATEEEQFANLVALYPNPSEGYFNINWPHSEKAVMHILDMTGKKIRSESIEAGRTQTFDAQELSHGMYVLQFQTSKMTFSKKLIIQ